MITVEAQIEAEQLRYWAHLDSPLDNAAVYSIMAAALAETKAERAEALRRHDHGLAAELLQEIRDQTAICAAMAEGLGAQRGYVLASDRQWPLGRLG